MMDWLAGCTVLVVSPSVISIIRTARIQQPDLFTILYNHPALVDHPPFPSPNLVPEVLQFAKESREQAAETCLVLTPLLLRDSPVSTCLQYFGIRRLEEPLLPSFPLLISRIRSSPVADQRFP
ncbi:hypothetical protein BO82DRAFT_392804 [Aspergillus uvarum CBS 121591]|uniref:Uncharacterized protein n=1 Tax=Aspergillus uvarum CBS 121591 TaxID=1448315 RepID=A0A319CQ48_9EURO|nr:hypothetical protein BO82DRAFT_392804 [Aspergillus uvarum CBS 121591]PYH80893.1 hypothetical protein BO82DRAFT_392804 [Aspergillus uvarum CBS 121591]